MCILNLVEQLWGGHFYELTSNIFLVDIENDDDDTTGKIVKRSAGGVNLNYESGVWTDFNSLLTWYRRNNLEQVRELF